MSLSNTEAEAVAAICLLAALADGSTHADERSRLEQIFTLLDEGAHAGVYQRVVMGQTDPAREAAKLTSDAARTMAYDMAVGVCDADGIASNDERAFLRGLEQTLNIAPRHATETVAQGDEMAAVLLEDAPESVDADPAARTSMLDQSSAGAAAAAAAAAGAVVARPAHDAAAVAQPTHAPDDQLRNEINSMVLRYSILNGAIELLPQNLATIAILPLQTKMVYRIGKRYGYSLSARHIKEFLGVLGVGMTSQVLEGYARKLFAGVAKKALGKTAGKLAGAATGPAMTFATTYALGHVAHRYYAGGRTLSAIDLKSLFQRSVGDGQRLYEQHADQVHQHAGGLNVGKVMNMVRGGATI